MNKTLENLAVGTACTLAAGAVLYLFLPLEVKFYQHFNPLTHPSTTRYTYQSQKAAERERATITTPTLTRQ